MNSPAESNQLQRSSPIARFLGVDVAIGGPFALLGVGYDADDPQILRARDRRLAQINQHPHRRTPDADEVRLAVHAAASQLFARELREELRQLWPSGEDLQAPPAWRSHLHANLPQSVLRSARMTLASCGGWNTKARRRLAQLARHHRVPAIDLLRMLAQPGARTQSSDRPRTIVPVRYPLPIRSARVWVVIYAALVCMLIALGAQLIIPATRIQIETPTVAADLISDAAEAIENLAASTALEEADQTRTIRHYSALVHEIEQASQRASKDPLGAATQVERYLPAFVEQWTQFPLDKLDQSAQQLALIHDRVQRNDLAREMLSKAMGSAASAENPLESAASLALRRLIRIDESDRPLFRELLSDALKQLAQQTTTDDPVWWSSWIHAVNAVHAQDDAAKSSLLLSAISARISESSPTRTWEETAALLVAELSWRSGSPERVWVLGALAEPTNFTDRLIPLINAIATHSAASGVRVTMVLADDATMNDRNLLADQYRSVWMRANASSDKFLDELSDELLASISLTGTSLDQSTAYRRFEELAHLNSTCWINSNTSQAQAQAYFNDAPLHADYTQTVIRIGLDAQDIDDEWALRLVNAEDEQQEFNALQDLEREPTIGLNTAHALVQLATVGSSRESRDFAERTIRRRSGSPQLLIALDHHLVSKRTTTRFRELIEGVVILDQTDSVADWDAAAHRALLAAISDTAAARQYPNASAFGNFVAKQYMDRLPATQQSNHSIQSTMSLLLNNLGVKCIELDADQAKIQRVITTHAVRSARSTNAIQIFVADQRALVELFALQTNQSIAGVTEQVQRVLSQLETRIRQSESVDDQIVQLERAQAELWLLQLREGRL